jgi:hypothetical protein
MNLKESRYMITIPESALLKGHSSTRLHLSTDESCTVTMDLKQRCLPSPNVQTPPNGQTNPLAEQ